MAEKKYFIDEEVVSEEEFWKGFERDSDFQSEDEFDEYLNDTYDEIEIGHATFLPSDVLYELDYYSYEEMLDEFKKDKLEEHRREFCAYDYIELNSSCYEFKEVEEEEEEEE